MSELANVVLPFLPLRRRDEGQSYFLLRPSSVVQRRLTFAYGKTYFLLRSVAIAILISVPLVFIATQFPVSPSWFSLFATASVLYTVVVGVSPLFTDHWLTRSRLIVRQGLYFRQVFDLADFTEIAPYEGVALLGLRFSRASRTLFVAGSRNGLVRLKLKTPRSFLQVFGLKVEEIIIDVNNRDLFVSALRERIAYSRQSRPIVL